MDHRPRRPSPGGDPGAHGSRGRRRPSPTRKAQAIVWLDGSPASLPPLAPHVRWVQLPGAGIDAWLGRIARDTGAQYTSARGVYAQRVAEYALALLLAGVRRIADHARTRKWEPRAEGAPGTTLAGATVAVIGAGGIGGRFIGMLSQFGAEAIAVTRRGNPVPGAASTLPAERIDEVWPAADHVLIAAPSTAETRWVAGVAELEALPAHAWLVNVARGALVDTDALVNALRRGAIAGAALDVTDPEPLPPDHPPWAEPRAIITTHVATPRAAQHPLVAERVRENLTRLARDAPLIYPVGAGDRY